MSIGERIKEERRRKGFSQEYVAKAISTTKQAIYKYETGIVTNIPTDKISKMASLFGVTPAYLMGWDENQSKENTQVKSHTKNSNSHTFISYQRQSRQPLISLDETLANPAKIIEAHGIIGREEHAAKIFVPTGKSFPGEFQIKPSNVRRLGTRYIVSDNEDARKLCRKILKLDSTDLPKADSFVEGLLAADKYQKSDENKK